MNNIALIHPVLKANFSRVLDMDVAGSVVGIDGPPW